MRITARRCCVNYDYDNDDEMMVREGEVFQPNEFNLDGNAAKMVSQMVVSHRRITVTILITG